MAIVVVLVVVSRWIGVSIPIGIFSFRKTFEPRTALIITWGGLRGGLSIALALNLPDSLGDGKMLILFLTYAVSFIYDFSARTYLEKNRQIRKEKSFFLHLL